MNIKELAGQFVREIEANIRRAEPSVWLQGPKRLVFIAFPQDNSVWSALNESAKFTVGMSCRDAGMNGEQVTGTIYEVADRVAKLNE